VNLNEHCCLQNVKHLVICSWCLFASRLANEVAENEHQEERKMCVFENVMKYFLYAGAVIVWRTHSRNIHACETHEKCENWKFVNWRINVHQNEEFSRSYYCSYFSLSTQWNFMNVSNVFIVIVFIFISLKMKWHNWKNVEEFVCV
jgi:hypothetical protein